MDDGTLGGDESEVLEDLRVLIEEFRGIGLELNSSKCELFFSDTFKDKELALSKFRLLAPNIKVTEKSSLHLLGAPVLDESFSDFLDT